MTAAVLAALGLALYAVHRHKQRTGAMLYRQKFVQLVMQLDAVTRSINELGGQVRAVKDARVLDYYEGTLRILETLLGAMRKIAPFGTDVGSLHSAAFLVRDCRQRVGRIQKAFQEAMDGRPVQIEELHGGDAGAQAVKVAGCYFCSRPVIVERFAEVKVRIDGGIRDVISCKVCRDELAAVKKVKVLHFMQDGKPVHWSLVPDYRPSEDFWNINKREAPPPKTRHLELVPSHTEASRSD